MADTDGSVKLGVDLDIDGAKKDAKTLGSTLKEMGSLFASAFQSADKAQQKAASTAAKANEAMKKQEIVLRSLKDKYDQLKNGEVSPKGLKQAEADARKAEKEFNRLCDQLDQAKSKVDMLDFGMNTDQLRQAKAEVEALSQEVSAAALKADKLRAHVETIRLNPEAAPEVAKLSSEISLAEEKLNRLKNEAEAASAAADNLNKKIFELPKFIKSAASAISGFGKKALSVFGTIGSGIKSVASGISGFGKKAFSVFGSIGGSIKKVFSGAKRDAGSFGKFANNMFTRLKGVILSAFIFNAVSKGLRELTSYIGSVIRTNREFMNSLAITKGNLLTAFQPILDVIMPALSILGNGLAYVTGLLVQFVSLLTGKSISQMQAAAKATNKQAQAIKNVGKEAKKARNELYPFDEIIKQTAEDTDSAGSGGFDELPVFEPPKFDMPAWIKEISLEIKAGNWEQAGETLADALNGMVDKVNFDGIGERIGQGLQSAFEFGLGFLRNIDTESIGASIAATVNGIFGNLSGETVGASIGAFWNRVVDFFYGIATQTDWSGIGQWIADAINGLFNEFDFGKLGETVGKTASGIVALLGEMVRGTDWAAVGQSVGDGINGVFENFDFENFGKTIGDTVKGIISLLSNIITTTDWEEVGHSFWEMLTGIDWSGIVYDMAQLLGEAIAGMGLLLWGFIKDAVSDIGDYFSEKIEECGGDVGAGLLKGILDGIGNIGDWVWDNIVSPFVGGLDKMLPGVKDSLNGVIQGFEDAINWIVNGINKIRFTVPEWVPGIGGRWFGFNLKQARLPRLATGDVVQPGKEFLAVLGDNKTEKEVVSPLSTIREALRAEMGGDELLSLLREILDAVRAGKVVVFGRKEVGDFVIDELGRRARSSGKAVIPV